MPTAAWVGEFAHCLGQVGHQDRLAALQSGAASLRRTERWRQHQGVARGNAARTFKGKRFVEAISKALPAPPSAPCLSGPAS